MSKLLDYALGVILLIALGLALSFGLAMTNYRDKAAQAADLLNALQRDVNTRNDEAQTKLDELTRQNQAMSVALTTLRTERESTDEANTKEIARLSGELSRRPVRVRLVPQASACGAGGGGTEGGQTAVANAGATDAASTYGLLPARNSERLARVIQEAETINAAYASCRITLIQNNALEESL